MANFEMCFHVLAIDFTSFCNDANPTNSIKTENHEEKMIVNCVQGKNYLFIIVELPLRQSFDSSI